MANMGGDENLFLRCTGEHQLGIRQGPVLEGRIDANFVGARRKTIERLLRQAESPSLIVVRGAVGHPMGSIGQGVQPGPELVERKGRSHRDAVVDYVQVRSSKIHHALPRCVLDPGIPDVPLLGNGPIEDGSSGRHLTDGKRHMTPHDLERAANAVSRDAPANGVELFYQRQHGAAGVRLVRRLSSHGLTHRKLPDRNRGKRRLVRR